MGDWNDILSNKGEQLSDEELLKYLHNELSEDKKAEIAKKIENNAFEADAYQGLSKMESKEQVQKHVNQLNQRLRLITGKKKRKKEKFSKISQWIILAIILLLFVCVIGFLLINLQRQSTHHAQLFPSTIALQFLI